jgi:hypothetical protein
MPSQFFPLRVGIASLRASKKLEAQENVMLISVIVTLVVVGLVLYLIDLIPMDGTIKRIIHLIIVIVVILWLLQVFGLMGPINRVFH